MVIEGNFYKNLYLIERNFTQISYPIREFFLEKTPKLGAHPRWHNNGSAPPPPPSGIVATVYMLFVTVSEQKSKVRLISEISEFSYLALGQIRKLGKIFPSFRNDLIFMSNYISQW